MHYFYFSRAHKKIFSLISFFCARAYAPKDEQASSTASQQELQCENVALEQEADVEEVVVAAAEEQECKSAPNEKEEAEAQEEEQHIVLDEEDDDDADVEHVPAPVEAEAPAPVEAEAEAVVEDPKEAKKRRRLEKMMKELECNLDGEAWLTPRRYYSTYGKDKYIEKFGAKQFKQNYGSQN